MSDSDVILSVILSAIVIVLFVFFYTKIFTITFDENFARATGIRAGIYNMNKSIINTRKLRNQDRQK